MTYLIEKNVPFVIRLREDMYIETEDRRTFQFRALAAQTAQGKMDGLASWHAAYAGKIDCVSKGEKSGVANCFWSPRISPLPKMHCASYRKRWGIECLFADAKTRGFNIEDTHITAHGKLATLLAAVALAMTWGIPMRKSDNGSKGHPEKSSQAAFKVMVQGRVRCSAPLDLA